jgi:hypothetical protein
MAKEKEAFEKIPDFTFSGDIQPEIEKRVDNPVISQVNTKLSDIDDKKINDIKENILKPSKLKVEQAFSLVDFESYKGNLTELFEQLSFLYQSMSRWSEEAPVTASEKIANLEISNLLNKMGYLPNHQFLPNLIQVLASDIESGNFDIGSAMHTEIIFQSFKRIYNQRIQLILLPFIQYIYSLDRKLLTIKKIAWQVLNKNGRAFEAAFIMDDIQKSFIRIKKAQELLIQEKYNLEERCEENIDLLLILAKKQEVLLPVYKAYKEGQDNKSLDIEKYLSELYEIGNQPPKPLSQQLLTYKTGFYGEKIINKIIQWTDKNTGIEFKKFLLDCFLYPLANLEIDNKNFPLILRDIIFTTMETAKKRNWATSEIIGDLVFVIFNSLNIDDTNKLKIVAYNLGSEAIFGIIKVKYKIDEAVQGLAKGLVHLIPDSIDLKGSHFFSLGNNYRITTEFVYSGMWDSTLEVYPNLLTVEKNGELFTSVMKSESQKLKFSLSTQEIKAYQANLVISSGNQF